MRYEDYNAEVILRECLPEYGRSVMLCVVADSEAEAKEIAKKEFTVFTGLPQSLIESIEAAPTLTPEEKKGLENFLDGYSEAHRETEKGKTETIKLLIGGSPCTHWSIAQSKNRETKPEGLGWELFKNYLIAMEKYSPDFFLYENNKSMSKDIREQITRELGVEPIMINSALVSAQNRQRLYWTNIPGVRQPEDKGILMKDILESGLPIYEKGFTLKANYSKASAVCAMDSGHFPAPMAVEPLDIFCINQTQNGKSRTIDAHMGKLENCLVERMNNPNPAKQQYDCVVEPINITEDGKGKCLRASCYKDGIRNLIANEVDRRTCVAIPVKVTEDNGKYEMAIETPDKKVFPIYEVRNGRIEIKRKTYPIKLKDGYYIIRKLSVKECMRLQTVPDSYIFPVSNTQAYKMLGNGWTVDVITHILSFCPGIKEKRLQVFSMYDGMGCGHIALDKLGCDIEQYIATEIDKHCIKTATKNFPDIIELGDAFQVRSDGWNIREAAGK